MRRWQRAVLACAVGAASAGAAPSPAAAAGPDVVLEAHAAHAEVRAGAPTGFVAHLATSDGDEPVAGEVVELYAFPAGAAGWTLVGTATTDAEGAAAFEVTPVTKTRYSARHADSAAAGAATSGDVTVATTPGPTAPQRPERLLAQGGDGHARLSWLPPADDGGQPVTGYVVTVYEPYATYPVKTVTTGPAARSVTVTGLRNRESYTFGVRAVNGSGASWEDERVGAFVRAGAPPPAQEPVGGTRACGRLPAGTTTWDAAGAPYHVCDLGVVVPIGSTLVVDGAEVRFQAPADPGVRTRHGLTVYGGLRVAGATLRGAGDGPGQWGGVAAEAYPWWMRPQARSAFARHHAATVRLVDTTVRHATEAVSSDVVPTALRLTGVTLADASGAGLRAPSAPVRVTRLAVRDVGGDGVRIGCARLDVPSGAPCPLLVDGLTVDRAGGLGLAVNGPGPVSVRGVVVTRSGTVAPVREAARFTGMTASYGAGGDIEDVRGGGNGIDAVLLRLTATRDLVWRTPAAGTAEAPAALGFLSGGIVMARGRSVTFPAGSVVKGAPRMPGEEWCHSSAPGACGGGIHVTGGGLDAAVPGSVFTSVADGDAGIATCPSALAPACGAGSWSGLGAYGAGSVVTVTGAAFRHGGVHLRPGRTAALAARVTATSFADSGEGVVITGEGPVDEHGAPTGTVTLTGLTMTRVREPLAARWVGSLTVEDVTVAAAGAGVELTAMDYADGGTCDRRSAVRLRDVTVDGVVGPGLRLAGLCRPDVRDVRVRGSVAPGGEGQALVPAVTLTQVHASVGGADGDIGGLTGGGNELDAVSISGTVTGGLRWVSPHNDAADHPLGYVVADYGQWHGGLALRGGDLVVPADGVVGFGRRFGDGPYLTLYGGALDASAGGARFVSTRDPLVPGLGCGRRVACATTRWGGVRVFGPDDTHHHWGKGGTGDARVAGATFRGGDLQVTTQDDRADAIVSVTDTDSDSPIVATGPVRAVVTGSRAPAFRIVGARSAEVTGNTAYGAAWDGPAPVGILLSGRGADVSDDVVLRGNTASGTAGPGFALAAVRAAIGPGGDVDGNTGSGTAAVLALSGVTATADLAWVSPTTEPAPHPVGYVISRVGTDTPAAGLTVAGAHTVTLPRGAVVKSDGALRLTGGATVDGTAGGAVFTSIYDSSVGVPTCAAPYRNDSQLCGDPRIWGLGIGGEGAVALTGARVTGYVEVAASGAAAPGAPGFGLALDRTYVAGWVTADGAAASLTHTRVGGEWDGVLLARSSGNVVRDVVVEDTRWTGLDLLDADAEVRETVLRRTGRGDLPHEAHGALRVRGTAGGTFSCLDLRGNGTGVAALGQPLTVTDSVLTGNTATGPDYGSVRYDLHNATDVTTDGVWWGQAGGPAAGQVRDPARHVDTAARSAPPACAVADAAVPPTAPRDAAAAAAASAATVTWAAPAADGGAPVTAYRVTAAPGGATAVVGGSARAATVTGLANGTAYVFTVTATSAAGEGAPSAPTAPVTPRPVTPTALSASAPAVVTYGSGILTGRLTAAGAGLAGRTVRVYVRPAGRETWGAPVAALTTSATGHVAYRLRLRGTADLRLRYAGDATTAAAVSAPRTVALRPVVTLALSDADVPKGVVVALTGRVTPNLAGRQVTLQRYTSRGWQPVARATLSPTSAYRFGVRWWTRGSYAYRVVSPASPMHARAVSPARILRVT